MEIRGVMMINDSEKYSVNGVASAADELQGKFLTELKQMEWRDRFSSLFVYALYVM